MTTIKDQYLASVNQKQVAEEARKTFTERIRAIDRIALIEKIKATVEKCLACAEPISFNLGNTRDLDDLQYSQEWSDQMVDWLDTKELRYSVKEDHDGVGIKSWHVISFSFK